MKDEKKITRRKFIKDSAMAAAGVSALAVGTTSGLNLFTRGGPRSERPESCNPENPRGWDGFPNRLRLAESGCHVLGVHPEQCV